MGRTECVLSFEACIDRVGFCTIYVLAVGVVGGTAGTAGVASNLVVALGPVVGVVGGRTGGINCTRGASAANAGGGGAEDTF